MIDVKNKIYEIIESMDEIFSLLIYERTINGNTIELINLIIEAFESLSKIEFLKNNELRNYENNFADELVSLINDINSGKRFLNFNEEIKFLFNVYKTWKSELMNKAKFKAIIYGLNSNTILVNEVIDNSKVEVINYIDPSGLNICKYLNGKPIVSIDHIKKTYFDYLILCEDMVCNKTNNNKYNIINFCRYMNYNFDYNFYKKYCEFLKSNKNYEGIITGLSYAEVGINTKYMDKNFFNFAVSSQDLFYDYEIVKYILSCDQIRTNLKYVIISLAYYSFDYDMSKSGKKIRTNIYYPIFKTMHNYLEKESIINEYELFCSQIKNVLKKNFYVNIYNLLKEKTEKYLYEVCSKKFSSKNSNDKEIESIVLNIKQTFNKSYPETQKENITILDNYLNLLVENGVKPIIVVCPESEFSRKYIDKEMETRFLNIIENLKQKYDLLLLNCFNNNDFEEADFYDGVHLNYDGARKFTYILNKSINKSK